MRTAVPALALATIVIVGCASAESQSGDVRAAEATVEMFRKVNLEGCEEHHCGSRVEFVGRVTPASFGASAPGIAGGRRTGATSRGAGSCEGQGAVRIGADCTRPPVESRLSGLTRVAPDGERDPEPPLVNADR